METILIGLLMPMLGIVLDSAVVLLYGFNRWQIAFGSLGNPLAIH